MVREGADEIVGWKIGSTRSRTASRSACASSASTYPQRSRRRSREHRGF